MEKRHWTMLWRWSLITIVPHIILFTAWCFITGEIPEPNQICIAGYEIYLPAISEILLGPLFCFLVIFLYAKIEDISDKEMRGNSTLLIINSMSAGLVLAFFIGLFSGLRFGAAYTITFGTSYGIVCGLFQGLSEGLTLGLIVTTGIGASMVLSAILLSILLVLLKSVWDWATVK